MTDLLSPDQKLCFSPQKLSSLHDVETGDLFISDKETVSDLRKTNSTKIESILQGQTEINVKDTTSNINPLGLLAFGITGFLVNLSQTGLFPMNAMLAALGIFYGGIGLVITGIMEWKKNHMVNGVVYISFGFFWISNISSGIFVKLGWADPPDPIGSGFVLFIFGTFLFILFFVNIMAPLVVKIIFFTAFLSFWIQAAGLWLNKPEKVSASIGVVCCVFAIYAGFSEILNETYQTVILPMGPTFGRKKNK